MKLDSVNSYYLVDSFKQLADWQSAWNAFQKWEAKLDADEFRTAEQAFEFQFNEIMNDIKKRTKKDASQYI